MMISSLKVFLIPLFFLSCLNMGLAYQENEYNFSEEIDTILLELEKSLKEGKFKAKKVAISSISFSKNISASTQEYFLGKIPSLNREQVNYQLFICEECLQPRISVDQKTQNIKVEKGITDVEDYKRIKTTFKVNYIADINLSYNSENIILNLNIIEIKKQIRTVFSKTINYFTKKNETVSEIDFFIRENFIANVTFTNVIQLGVGENIYNKRWVGLYIDFAMPSTKIKSYFSFGPYLTVPLNSGRVIYKINMSLGYGIVNSGANAIISFDLISQFFPHVHALIGIKNSFQLINKVSTNGLPTKLPFSLMLGFGVDF